MFLQYNAIEVRLQHNFNMILVYQKADAQDGKNCCPAFYEKA